MNPVQYYTKEKEGLENLLKKTHLYPEYQLNLEKLIKEALVQVKGTLLLAQEIKDKNDEFIKFTGKQKENESYGSFCGRIAKMSQISSEINHLGTKYEKQKECSTLASKALNDYTTKLVKDNINQM